MTNIPVGEIEKKIIEIKNEILKRNNRNIGLITGEIGEIIFLEYYNKYFNDKEVTARIDYQIDKCFNIISDGYFLHTYSDGLSGILYGLEFINRKGFENIDIFDAAKEYQKLLIDKMLQDIHNKNYDFLHGAIGVAIYLLKHDSDKNKHNLKKLVEILRNIGVNNTNTIKWESENTLKNTTAYNISMSHGMTSIALFLIKMIQADIETKECHEILNKTINYILEQEIDYLKYGSYFPSYSIESELPDISKSRLGWCYGDLGIAVMLWEAGKILNNEVWKNKAIEIFKFSTSRTDLIKNSIFDAGLCHGTAGIAQVFRRMHYETKNELFLDTSNFWINKTIDIASLDTKFAGYKFLRGYPDTYWEGSYGFINGISGIGLALLASIGDESYSDWDEILLLS